MTIKAITTEKINELYQQLGSVWLVADKLKISGQTVHRRLSAEGLIIANRWTPEEDALLAEIYDRAGDSKGFLFECEAIFKKHKTNICRRAKKLGLTNKNRKPTEETVESMVERMKEYLRVNGHPKGMLGKKHTKENIRKFSEIQKNIQNSFSDEEKKEKITKMLETRKSNVSSRTSVNSYSRTKSGRREDLNCFFRSKVEANFARFLNHIGIGWVYEPKVFFFDGISRGCISYTPDFYAPQLDKWYEVKGWMDQDSTTRLKRFLKYHPEEAAKLVIVSQSKKTYDAAINLGYDVIKYEGIEKKYNDLPFWEKSR